MLAGCVKVLDKFRGMQASFLPCCEILGGLKDQVKLCQDKTRPLCNVLKLSAVRGSVSSRGFVPPLNCYQSLSCLLISVLRPFIQPICRGGTSPQPKNSSNSLMTS
jgi:hypothetical protein